MEKNAATTTDPVQSDDGENTPIEVAESGAFDDKATKRLLRKLDWNIIPFMSLIYL